MLSLRVFFLFCWVVFVFVAKLTDRSGGFVVFGIFVMQFGIDVKMDVFIFVLFWIGGRDVFGGMCNLYEVFVMFLEVGGMFPRPGISNREPPLSSHAVSYSFLHFLQYCEYAVFCGSVTVVLFTCVVLFWQSAKQYNLVCHLWHIGFPLSIGRFERFFSAKVVV